MRGLALWLALLMSLTTLDMARSQTDPPTSELIARYQELYNMQVDEIQRLLDELAAAEEAGESERVIELTFQLQTAINTLNLLTQTASTSTKALNELLESIVQNL